MPDRNRLVVVSAPEKDKATLPNETRIAAVIKGATGAPLTAYVDTVSTQPLLPMLPMPGAIAATSTNAAAGITEWRLSNGVRVILKPTTFKQDEIIFRAVSPGGTSLASDADYIPAATAAQVMAEGGLGSIKRLDLEKILAGSTAACESGYRPDGRSARRRRHTQGSGDDVSARLPHVYGAAGGSRALRRADGSPEDRARQPGIDAGDRASTRRCRRRSARTTSARCR
jgi:hypothetical protein